MSTTNIEMMKREVAFMQQVIKALENYSPGGYDQLYKDLALERKMALDRAGMIPNLIARLEEMDPRNTGKARCFECGTFGCTRKHRDL